MKKYYINSERAKTLIQDLQNKDVLGEKSVAYMNSKTIDKVDQNVGKTLCARDYKGFGTGFDTMNGVIEKTDVIIGGMQKNQAVKTDGVCTTLCSAMGTGGGYVPMITENPDE